MATTFEASPFEISPAFNELRFIVNSTNVNETGFKYIFDIYESGTTNKIAERKVSPQYLTGFGDQDLSKLLQGFVSGDFNPASLTTFDAERSYYKYDLSIGEEYVAEFNYVSPLVQNGSFTKITVAHSFVVGDAVVITQADGGVANPGLEGLFVVTAITGTTDFTINSLWSEVTNINIDGTAKYSDNRKIIFRDIITSNRNLVFNGAFSFLNWIDYNQSQYQLISTTSKLLTDLPDQFSIFEGQEMWVNVLNQESSYYVYFENETGTTYRKAIPANGVVNQVMVSGGGLQSVLSLVSGSGDLVTNDVDWYEFYIVDISSLSILSQRYRLNIDRRCKINDYQLAFRDRKGSMLSYGFQLHDVESGTVKRTTYNKEVIGSIGAGSKWGYQSYERGMKQVDITKEETLTLRTNYIKTQDELDLFERLVTSPDVFIKIDDNWLAVTVEDTSYNNPRLRTRRLQKKEIKVKLANQDIING